MLGGRSTKNPKAASLSQGIITVSCDFSSNFLLNWISDNWFLPDNKTVTVCFHPFFLLPKTKTSSSTKSWTFSQSCLKSTGLFTLGPGIRFFLLVSVSLMDFFFFPHHWYSKWLLFSRCSWGIRTSDISEVITDHLYEALQGQSHSRPCFLNGK